MSLLLVPTRRRGEIPGFEIHVDVEAVQLNLFGTSWGIYVRKTGTRS